ncbi:hypothetical protein B0H17DRAFT_1150856 [Mycena rosella]|uniref:Uncharacterized protein n=1 Tax=Mycena rosella TaxID=1033263 RepID=A0AAD7FJN6_MYCRO|nr:hypothetical protein B0H17DRAFT_1150856 [Mycena rosella]
MKFYESESDIRPLPAPSARRALDYRKIINGFVGKHRNLRHLDLTDIIGMRSHCILFSRTSTKFSEVFKITFVFPFTISLSLYSICTLEGLIEAHRKLSDYYHKLVLDPRISYEGLKHDFRHDDDLLNDLEDTKTKLDEYFRCNYTDTVSSTPVQSTSSPWVQSTSCIQSSPQKGFTQRYRMQPSITVQP